MGIGIIRDMKVLGIDPGIAITGIAVVEETSGKFRLLYSSAIETKAGQPTPERLLLISQKISDIVKAQKPDCAVLEKLFFNTNAKTAFAVGQARGVIISTIANCSLLITNYNLPIFEYTPLQVKMALTGYGRADKVQVQKMVSRILGLKTDLKPDDVADGAAIALTHLFSYKINTKISRS